MTQWWLERLSLDHTSRMSYCKQLAAKLRSCLLQPDCPTSEPLPTVRTLAAWLGVNFNTVARAYRVLEAENLLLPHPGIGTFVHPSTAEAYSKTKGDSIDSSSLLTQFLSWAETNHISIASLWEQYQSFQETRGPSFRRVKLVTRKHNRQRNHLT